MDSLDGRVLGDVYGRTEAPRLKDAGLENPALSPASIQSAFQLAAEKVLAAAPGAMGMPVDPPPNGGEDGGAPGGMGTEGVGEPGCVGVPGPGDAPIPGGEVIAPPPGADGESHPGGPGGDSCVDTKTGGLVEEGTDALVGGPRPEEGPGDAVPELDESGGGQGEGPPQLGGSGKGCVEIGLSGLGDIPEKLGLHIGGSAAPGMAM